MSSRIRGQEATIRVAVDGQIQAGSFFNVKDFSQTPRSDITEMDYLGQDETDLDFQHHGFDLSFSVDNEDSLTLEFLETIVTRERAHQRHPDITVMVIYAFRERGVRNKVDVFHDVFLKVGEVGAGGRKEYISTKFEGKAKRKSLLSA
jgi:hypothetical protein